MAERVGVVGRLRLKTDFPETDGKFAAMREYIVTIRADGFKTARAARERADEVAASLEAQVHHNFVSMGAGTHE